MFACPALQRYVHMLVSVTIQPSLPFVQKCCSALHPSCPSQPRRLSLKMCFWLHIGWILFSILGRDGDELDLQVLPLPDGAAFFLAVWSHRGQLGDAGGGVQPEASGWWAHRAGHQRRQIWHPAGQPRVRLWLGRWVSDCRVCLPLCLREERG